VPQYPVVDCFRAIRPRKGSIHCATQRRLGRFESANGGTIFLDEIGDLPADIQIALLRVLQEREIDRIGARKPIPVDVRILAATHRDLTALAAEGRFRQDLLYRLNVVPIKCLHYANGKTTFRCCRIFHWPALEIELERSSGQSIRNARTIQRLQLAGQYQRASERDEKSCNPE